MYRGWTKIMDATVRDAHFFINMELGHHLPEETLVEYCTILLLVA
jgi:hypothetical protein